MKLSHYKSTSLIMAKGISVTILFFLTLLMLWVNGCTKRENGPAVPEQQGWVSDFANVLQPEDSKRIASALESYEKETCHQVFLLVIPSLAGENIEDFSKRVATAWHIGQIGLDNGILVTIAMQEGSVRIETGRAFEWMIRDGTADRILKDVMFPLFRQEKFVEGIEQGLKEIMAAGRTLQISDIDKPEICQ